MWKGDKFFYSKRILKVIAENYTTLYEGLPLSFNEEVTNPWALAEYKADFDKSLNSIGPGEWDGKLTEFKHYKYYGRLQKIIIAEILGIDNNELGFYGISRLRGYAYYLMVKYLNDGIDIKDKEYYNKDGGK